MGDQPCDQPALINRHHNSINKKMKQYFIVPLAFLAACNNQTADGEASYEMQDLKKLNWIEGNWVGMDGTKPFYEIYKITSDSTLEITSYSWNGTDSTGSSKSYVVWRNGNYFLGENQNWKVTEITGNSIAMVPVNKAANDILWKKSDDKSWMAVLKTKNGEKQYHMKPVYHFHK